MNTGVGPFYSESGELINDDFKISEVLRVQYESVFSQPLEERIVHEELFDETDLELEDDTRITGIHFDREDIKVAIDSLSNHAAPCLDGFPSVILNI